jgi:diadenylate cyclase
MITNIVGTEKKEIKTKDIFEALKFFSPGTPVRMALDDILRARMGALIVVENGDLSKIVEGGFRINSKFSPQKLVELAKMDGAIILSQDLKKILYANTLLRPSINTPTQETGTRHKAADRTARQFNTMVIAISERKRKITLYFRDKNYFLEQTSEILRRAAENLQILEKQKDIFNDLVSHLNMLEIMNLVSISDVCNILQSLETIKRISDNVRQYLIELGKEGGIVSMRLKELTKNLSNEREMILKDYLGEKNENSDEMLENMSFDFLLETSNISRILFGELHDKPVSPKGLRILEKTNLLQKDVDLMIGHFDSLEKIFNTNKEDLKEIFQNENLIESTFEEIKKLKEKILVGKGI